MPVVTESLSPSGLPTAITGCPAVTSSESPRVAGHEVRRRVDDLQHGQVGGRVQAHDLDVGEHPAVGQHDLDLRAVPGAGGDVVVGQDVALGVEHDAGALALAGLAGDLDAHHARRDGVGDCRPVDAVGAADGQRVAVRGRRRGRGRGSGRLVAVDDRDGGGGGPARQHGGAEHRDRHRAPAGTATRARRLLRRALLAGRHRRGAPDVLGGAVRAGGGGLLVGRRAPRRDGLRRGRGPAGRAGRGEGLGHRDHRLRCAALR